MKSIVSESAVLAASRCIGFLAAMILAALPAVGAGSAKHASTLDYLRKVADRKGISFYTHTIFDLSTK